jgi:hypothetical protein
VEWLAKEGNFDVAEVGDLRVKYTYSNGRSFYDHYEVS